MCFEILVNWQTSLFNLGQILTDKFEYYKYQILLKMHCLIKEMYE
jgi:hypothetical protein